MAYVRPASLWRNVLGSAEFPYEDGRYLLYMSLACPWADGSFCTALVKGIVPRLKGVVRVHPTWGRTAPEKDGHCGWIFRNPGEPVMPIALANKPPGIMWGHAAPEYTEKNMITTENCDPEPIFGCRTLRELYEKDLPADAPALGAGLKFTTPMLFDTKTNKVVSNESLEILRMFNAWPEAPGPDIFPAELENEAGLINEMIYHTVNNGVYKCGFAADQFAYNENAEALENSMHELEKRMSDGRQFLLGDKMSYVDIRLFMTLIRMDEIYVIYFKCFFASLNHFPTLLRYTSRLYQDPNFRAAIFMDDIKKHYFTSHPMCNSYAIIPRETATWRRIVAGVE